MLSVCKQWVGLGLLLLFLAGCGFAGQPRQITRIADSAPTATATAEGPGSVLDVPALPTATRAPTPPTRPPATPAMSVSRQLEQRLFALINQDRTAQGVYLYVLNSTLSTGARLHSVRMSSCGLSHQCPGEPNPCQRVTNENIVWTSCGENVGYTSPYPTAWGGVQGIEKAMLAEQPPDDGHRLNLLSASFHRIGIGICIDARGYVWITEDFAS